MNSIPAEVVAFPLLVIRVLASLWLPGVFLWAGGQSIPCSAGVHRFWSPVLAAIQIILLGTLWFLASGLLLAVAGLLSPGSLLLSGMVPAVATVIRRRQRPENLAPGCIWLSLLVVLGITSVVIVIPRPGEWLVGGWDPGIYLNQGMMIARNGSVRFQPPAYLNALSAPGFRVFTRGGGAYRELFPGCPVDPATRRPLLYFFPLTSVAAALLETVGGLPLLVRTGWFFGLLAPLFFLAALFNMGFGPRAAALGTAALALHPLFLYHLHFPVSEVLQLTLLCCLALVSADSRGVGWVCLILLLLVVNRLAFFVFGALWVVLQSAAEGRLRLRTFILYAAALIAGSALDRALVPATFLRRADDCHFVLVGGGALLACVIPLYLWGRRPGPRKTNRLPLLLIFTGIVIALVASKGLHSLAAIPRRTAVLLAFSGPWVSLAAAAGLALVIFAVQKSTATDRPIRLWAFFTSAVVFILLGYPAITPLYPWALRRYMPYLVTAVGLGIAVLVHRMSGTGRRAIATLLIAASLAMQVPLCIRATTSTEYDGLLAALGEMARHTGDRDVIIADHPKWGTPLAYVSARNVLDGRRIWRHAQPQRLAAACRQLNELREAGFRVLFLCSDEKGLGVYPLSFEAARLVCEVVFPYCEVVQHPLARTWKTRPKRARFRLYEVHACHAAARSPAPGPAPSGG